MFALNRTCIKNQAWTSKYCLDLPYSSYYQTKTENFFQFYFKQLLVSALLLDYPCYKKNRLRPKLLNASRFNYILFVNVFMKEHN